MRMYASSAKNAHPNVETSSVGIQNNNILKNLSPIRLVLKNNRKSRIVTIQKRGDTTLSANAPAAAAIPVALSGLMPLKGDQGTNGRNSARNIAASPLRIFVTYSIEFD